MYTLHLAKETFKFSCSHFTIWSASHAERLHGHNYRVRLKVKVDQLDPALGLAFDFNAVKPLIRAACERLDERILLPARSPHLKMAERAGQIDVRFADKHYVFPTADTVTLPIVNVTSEELARYLADELLRALAALPFWTELEVNVEETRGQSVSFTVRR